MPSPSISRERRTQWQALSNQAIIDTFTAAGVTVTLKNSNNRHFKVKGHARPVELYATTGTVNAAQHQHRKACTARNMSPERAIERAISLAKHGH